MYPLAASLPILRAPQQSRLVTLAPENQVVLLALNAAAIYVGVSLGTVIGGLVIDQWGISALGFAGGVGGAVALFHLLSSEMLAKQSAS